MIENCITSFVEGRIRVRHPIFTDELVVAQIQSLLQNLDGVESIQCNTRSGSLLLQYDADVLDKETLIGLLKQGEQWLFSTAPQEVEKKPCLATTFRNMTTREKRKLYNRTMAVSLGMTAMAIGVGNKRLHVLAGSVFLGLSLWHIKRMRKALK